MGTVTGGSVVPPDAGARGDVYVTGRRVVATLVDGLLFGLLFVAMAALFGNVVQEGPASWDGSMPAVPSVAYGAIVVLYYVLMEGYLGQTLGKMLLGIRWYGRTPAGRPGRKPRP
ncbi:hypothetical protein GBA65_07870 [Rubrobacter marinus]|uniref:RDD domain-containing protein n=1 Tax=Rubrobacter marinus TaxID=2653852 RepID=A0A6G8PWA4_9ACTN|nr:RDD family protein [Rubrobacter marinus]QIN78455.1 hypothetical protein GBA65_07870 [Rubrobacter marinus]